MAVELTLRVDPTTADAVSGWCWSLGCIGLEETPGRLRVYFADDRGARAAAEMMSEHLSEPPALVREYEWTEPAAELVAGRFAINQPAGGSEVPVRIDPRRAFGSGAHPSTRAALELVSTTTVPLRVIDVGTGTGVLAIAAASMGAARVLAVDIDAEALAAADANVRANGVSDIVEIAATPVTEVTGSFEMALVNLTIDRHEGLADAITGRLETTGAIIGSGVLAGPQESRLRDCYHGWIARDRVQIGEWSAVRLER